MTEYKLSQDEIDLLHSCLEFAAAEPDEAGKMSEVLIGLLESCGAVIIVGSKTD